MSNTRRPINRISHLFDACAEPTPIDQSGPRYPIETAPQPIATTTHEITFFFLGIAVGVTYNLFFAGLTWLVGWWL